jgi:RimJ/RimL family protein N-acetyltransferase
VTARRVAYEIRVDGHLDEHWAPWIGDASAVRNGDGTTTFVAAVDDRAEVHGILAGLRDIGATLLSLRAVDPSDPRPVAEPDQPPTTPQPALRHPLSTARLTLRPATPDDADVTWRYRRLPVVNEWITGTPAAFVEYRARFADPERLASTVIVELRREPSPEVVGDFLLERGDAWAQLDVLDQARGRQVELGWVLDPEHTGHGYATEAARELVRYCFTDLQVRRVVAGCFLGNEPSWRLMERLGMRRETHAVRDALHRRGAWLDSVSYALLIDEWASCPPRS